jgi:hypothetical protein
MSHVTQSTNQQLGPGLAELFIYMALPLPCLPFSPLPFFLSSPPFHTLPSPSQLKFPLPRMASGIEPKNFFGSKDARGRVLVYLWYKIHLISQNF